MSVPFKIPDDTVSCAAAVLACKDYGLRGLLDAYEAPLYVTDESGLVVYANEACAAFAGRAPCPGEDRWCVTWKLYTDDGQFLPHAECPMALAIREKAPIVGATAVAERPDGTRVAFAPSPTPLFGRNGELIGAVNVLTALS